MADKIMRTFAREAKDMVSAWNQATTELHNALQRYIFIGETLRRVRAGLDHGEFEPWIEANLPFGVRRAQCCMQFYEQAHNLKSPAAEQLAGMWHDIQRGDTPKAQRAALLPPAEVEDLKRSEGGVEPEEKEAQVSHAPKDTPPKVAAKTKPQPKPDKPSTPVTETKDYEGEPEVPTDADGVPIPTRILPIFTAVEQFDALVSRAHMFRGQIEDAVEANPDAFAALPHQELSASLSVMVQTLRKATPYLICPVCGGEDPEKRCNLCGGRLWLSRMLAQATAIELRNPQRKAAGLALLTATSQKAGEVTA
jgi:hypothetical protein